MVDESLLFSLSINYIYRWCNDLTTMRNFYTSLIGLDEGAFTDTEEYGFIEYISNDLRMYILRGTETEPQDAGWAKQPGYLKGDLETTSYTIKVPEIKYHGVVRRLQDANVKSFQEQPIWLHDEYWSYIVQDPMGITVELYMQPSEKPDSNEWHD
jgi:hypothetical protein